MPTEHDADVLEEMLVSIMGTSQWIWSLQRCWPVDEPKQACRRHLCTKQQKRLSLDIRCQKPYKHISLSFLFLCVSLSFIPPNMRSHSQWRARKLVGLLIAHTGRFNAELNDGWNSIVCFESWRTVKLCLAHTQFSYTCPSLIRGHSCSWMSRNFTVQTEHFHNLFFILKTKTQ